jgi:hypothetical protein
MAGMKMKFGKKTMFIIVLIFLGILLFMYFRNSGREGMRPSSRAPTLEQKKEDCKKQGKTYNTVRAKCT